MAEVTLELPDSLAGSLPAERDQLTRVLELGLRAWTSEGRPEYAGVADVLEALARLPSPEEILALRPSPALQSRIEELLEKNRGPGLNAGEQREWQSYEYLEHLVRLAKANAVAKRRPAAGP